jgi:hypothetical protein
LCCLGCHFFVDSLKEFVREVDVVGVREFVWAIQAVVGRTVVCQAVVDGVPGLPVELARCAKWRDANVQRGVVLILGSLAVVGCRMPGYDRRIVVNAIMNGRCEKVRCIAVYATAKMILNSKNQNVEDQFSDDEVHEIVQMLISRCYDESFLVCEEIIVVLPRIVKYAMETYVYRLIVADHVFGALARLAQHDAMREVGQAKPVLSLITDLFLQALAEGWAGACLQAFEDEGGLEILVILRELNNDGLNAHIDEFCRRVEEWKVQNREPQRS